MKIGIEAQRIFRKNKHGMDMVALELIKNLQQTDHENEYFIFVKPGEDREVIKSTGNFKIVELKGGPYPLWEQFALPRAAREHNCDILHCTSNTAPVRTVLPLITTLHDIIYLEKISLFTRGGTPYQKLGNMYRRWIVPPVVKKSRKIITVSNFEKERIDSYFGFGGDRLVSVYNGVGSHFKPVEDNSIKEEVKLKYKLPDNYLFFLGNTDPKKNTPNVLRAFARFREQADQEYSLVMLDYEEKALNNLLEKIGHPELREAIHLTGYVVNTDLPAIINQAAIFLYPSLRESFGIPILEGMACGVPVITSNTSSMPEVAGDAALLVNPSDPDEITSAITKVLSDKDLYQELSARGVKRAAKFSWRAMAESVLKIYQDVYHEVYG